MVLPMYDEMWYVRRSLLTNAYVLHFIFSSYRSSRLQLAIHKFAERETDHLERSFRRCALYLRNIKYVERN